MAAHGDGVVRVVLSRGGAVPGDEAPARCVVMFHELPIPKPEVNLVPVPAPWHPAGEWYELAGAKTLSYAPNLAAQRTAQARGFDDALLVASDGTILECPTASIAWVVDGVIETPMLALHILDSITRRTMLILAEGRWKVAEDRFGESRLASATEVMIMSTVREITPVTAVGDLSFEPGPITATLGASFRSVVDAGRGA
jgi:4-amino-4-deoxychorismate lyase